MLVVMRTQLSAQTNELTFSLSYCSYCNCQSSVEQQRESLIEVIP